MNILLTFRDLYQELTKMIEKLLNKSDSEKAIIKSQEIVKVFPISRTERPSCDIEILQAKVTPFGLEIQARAWSNKGAYNQYGFGPDGTVDIERFIFRNPPILVPDPNGQILRTWIEDGIPKERRLREDPLEALLQSLEHTISVKKEKFDATKIVKGKIGSTTFTFYPNAGAGTAPVDGELGTAGADTTFINLVNDSGTASDDVDATSRIQTRASTTSNQFQLLRRGGFGFDTSSLNTVSSATLSLYGSSKATAIGDPNIDIVDFQPGNEADFATTDYPKANFGTTRFATGIAASGFSTSAYNDYALNASGLSNINLTGNTFFGARISWDIDEAFGGSWVSGEVSGATIFTADQAGTTNDPKLVVEGTGGAAVVASHPGWSFGGGVW